MQASSRPLVVASVNNPEDLPSLERIELSEHCDVLEFRLDGLQETSTSASYIENCTVPTLITARCPNEGAFSDLKPDQRFEMIRIALGYANYVDLECETIANHGDHPALSDILKEINGSDTQLVASYHDFIGVPSESFLAAKLEIAKQQSAIFKLACTVETLADLTAFTRILSQLVESSHPFSAMGMGRFGMATRLTAASAGSVLNYGYLHSASVAGQWPAMSLKQALTRLPSQA